MGGEECVIIIQGNIVQGGAATLSTTVQASCQLVNYLALDPDANFNDEDGKPIAEFHKRATKKLIELNEELDTLNHELAHKYSVV